MSDADKCDPKHRRLVVQALAAGFFAGGFFGRYASAQEVFSRLPAKLPEDQSIYRISGDVQVNGNAASLRTRIAAGDTVVTGRDGEVAFVVGDSAFMQRGDSNVEMQAAPRDSLLLSGFRLITGALLSVFECGEDQPVADILQPDLRRRLVQVGVHPVCCGMKKKRQISRTRLKGGGLGVADGRRHGCHATNSTTGTRYRQPWINLTKMILIRII